MTSLPPASKALVSRVKWLTLVVSFAVFLAYVGWLVSVNIPNEGSDIEYWDSVRIAGVVVWHGQVKSRHQYLTDADGQPKYEHNGTRFPGKIPDGWCYSWHRNGQLERRELWHDGQSGYTGNTIFLERFDERGNLTRRIVGGAAGTDTTWYPSGRPHIHIEMTYNDTPHGETIEWDESGNIVSVKLYDKGVLKSETRPPVADRPLKRPDQRD